MVYEGPRQLFKTINIRNKLSYTKKNASVKGFKPAVRLNGTSDISWERFKIFEMFPGVQFYDYTKIYKRASKMGAG